MNKIFFCFIIISVLGQFYSTVTEAKLIQILHTNDTHSYLDNISHDPSTGGSARLKGLMDFYKNKMAQEGVKTIAMDAGDFAEGNLFYMADQGRKVFEIQNEMGYDVGTIGNHDYLMGTKDFDKILGELDLKLSFVAANLQMNPFYKNIREKIKPYKEIKIDGIKIAILGLTTNDIFYKWRFEEGIIANPYKVAKQFEKILKARDNDFIIALTHLGVLRDIKLAEKTKYIDLIVGGHSHTALYSPSFGVNENKQSVPIVQAGMHTEYLGRLILDLEKGKPLKIVKYELIPVKYEPSDFKMERLVQEANNDLNATYGKDWLNEQVGYSDLSSTDPDGSRKWAYFITDAMKEKANVEIAIHTPFMNGENFPVGPVTRRDLFNSLPRVFDLTEKFGWTIYTTKIKGIWLRLVFQTLTHFGQPLTFSGITMEQIQTEHGTKIKNILVNGVKIDPFKYYTVAFTEGVIRGTQAVSQVTKRILQNPLNTQFNIWHTLEEKLGQSMDGPFLNKNNNEYNHTTIMPNQNREPDDSLAGDIKDSIKHALQ